MIRKLLREPLVQFLLLGGLMFAFFGWKGGAGPGSDRIVITPGLIEHLAAGFTRTWQRPPSAAELKGLIDDHVKEEIATREAMAMGLDRDDVVIRRRLRQKLEFLGGDIVAQAPITDAEVRDWIARHPDRYGGEPQIGLLQVFVSTERRGPAADAHATRLLARLRAAGPEAAAELGDPTLLPAEVPFGPLREVERTFGQAFAAEVMALEPGRWSGPLGSPYGLHLVYVTRREAASAPDTALVRPLVERDLLADRQRQGLERMYEGLLRKYTVVVDRRAADSAAAGAGAPR